MEIYDAISSLVEFGLQNEFFEKDDKVYIINKYLHLFNLEDYKEGNSSYLISEVMNFLFDYVNENKILTLETVADKDNFDAYVMDVMLPRPHEIISKFYNLYQKNPKIATAWFYDVSILNRYIRVDRLAKNIKFNAKGTKYDLDITINLSKPEKDPKEIARLKTLVSSSYPKCALCIENEGFYGTLSKAARSNHRIIPLKLNNEDFYFQYSPYGYYNEHCIVLKKEHSAMSICPETFKRLLDFVSQFPHYFLGSNADLPIVGGSILSHEHYQGGNYTFPEAKAPLKYKFKVNGYDNVECGIVSWPMSVIRLNSNNKEEMIELASHILDHWRSYSDEENDIIANDGEPHNTITPIARMNNGLYELDLVLRNNRTSKEYEDGIFHPHKDIHHIKKENIGLIEVMGLAVLPGRLKEELELVKQNLLKNGEISEKIEKHLNWISYLKQNYANINADNIDDIIKHEVAIKFERCLIDAGVYKETNKGLEGFKKFIDTL